MDIILAKLLRKRLAECARPEFPYRERGGPGIPPHTRSCARENKGPSGRILCIDPVFFELENGFTGE
jgi:hypothetical protein